MPFDRVEVIPGKPHIFALTTTSDWVQMPKEPKGTYTVLFRHRPGNQESLLIATSASPGNNYTTVETTEELPVETDNLNRFWYKSASGGVVFEVIAQQSQLKP